MILASRMLNIWGMFQKTLFRIYFCLGPFFFDAVIIHRIIRPNTSNKIRAQIIVRFSPSISRLWNIFTLPLPAVKCVYAYIPLRAAGRSIVNWFPFHYFDLNFHFYHFAVDHKSCSLSHKITLNLIFIGHCTRDKRFDVEKQHLYTDITSIQQSKGHSKSLDEIVI